VIVVGQEAAVHAVVGHDGCSVVPTRRERYKLGVSVREKE
jgi:hypothetical protein